MKKDQGLELIYENMVESCHQQQDHEGGMALNQIETIITAANKLKSQIGSSKSQLPSWVQSKISLAEDYIVTAANYVESGIKTGDPEISQVSQNSQQIKIPAIISVQ